MDTLLIHLRAFNIWSVALRLALSMVCGGCIGIERGRKQRAAGLRTHMVGCIGAALAMLLGQYEIYAQDPLWNGTSGQFAVQNDVTRYGAQVINGIGFIGAGTVMVTGLQEVKGLTTAAGL